MNNLIENSMSADDSATLQYIALSKITGVHPTIELLFAELSVPPFRALAQNAFSEQQIQSLLDIFPLRIVRYRKHLRCSGNIRLYQLAIQHLAPTQLIPCLMETPASDKALQDRAIQECLFAPAALGIRFSETRLLAALARRAHAAQKLPAEPLVDEAYLAKLYDVDRRQLSDKAIAPAGSRRPSGKPTGEEQ
jgi:hypothetical protein